MTWALFEMEVEDYGTTPDVVYLPDHFLVSANVPERLTINLKITKAGEYVFNELLTVEEAQAIRDKLNEKIEESIRGHQSV